MDSSFCVGFSVYGLKLCYDQDLEARRDGQISSFGVLGLVLRVQGLGFRAWGKEFTVFSLRRSMFSFGSKKVLFP